MKKFAALILTGVMVMGVLAGCSNNGGEQGGQEGGAEAVTITVAASPTPHREILDQVIGTLAEQNITLKVVEYTDYVQPNLVTESGDVDANYFQHITYLNDFNAENGTHLVSVGAVHYEPFGLYAGKTATLDELADGAQIAVPNDGTNEGRALMLLEQIGLIKLREDVGFTATKLDIVENSKNLDIVEMEAAQLPRTLQDVDMAIINGNYAIPAGLSVADALAIEDASGDAAQNYANVLVVKEGNESNPAILALMAALQGDAVKEYMNATYGGAVQPLT